ATPPRKAAGATPPGAAPPQHQARRSAPPRRHRHYNADDQPGFEHFAKNDEECCQHERLTRPSWLLQCHHHSSRSWHHQYALRFAMKIIKETVAAGLLRPHVNHGFLADRHDLLEMQIVALEFRRDGVEIGDVNLECPSNRRM